MIFVTTGTQLGFPRLVNAMARIARTTDERVIVQTPDPVQTQAGFEHHRDLTPEAFDRLVADARLVVAHAGVGTLLDTARIEKPLVIMPRRHDLGEHRNDHQLATARHLAGRFPHVRVAWTEDDLERLIADDPWASQPMIAEEPELVIWLADLVRSPSTRRSGIGERLAAGLRRMARPIRPGSAAPPTAH